jgi:hypothetical protein
LDDTTPFLTEAALCASMSKSPTRRIEEPQIKVKDYIRLKTGIQDSSRSLSSAQAVDPLGELIHKAYTKNTLYVENKIAGRPFLPSAQNKRLISRAMNQSLTKLKVS